MDRIEEYRKIVKQLLYEYAGHKPATGQIETQTIFDEAQDR